MEARIFMPPDSSRGYACEKFVNPTRASAALAHDLRRLGERFSLEWIRTVGPDANAIFIPYYTR